MVHDDDDPNTYGCCVRHMLLLPDAVVICKEHNVYVCVAARVPLGVEQPHTGIQEQSLANMDRPVNIGSVLHLYQYITNQVTSDAWAKGSHPC